MKKISVMAVCLAMVGLLAGCGSKFDASAYITALLDNAYKNDSTQYVAMGIGTAEQALGVYEQGLDALDTEMSAFTSIVGDITDEQKAQVRSVMADILKGVRYTVGESEKQDDNSYVVTVTYEQMNVFTPAVELYADKIEEMKEEIKESVSKGNEPPSDDEISEMVLDALLESFKSALSNVTYDEPETTTIVVELVNNVYTPNKNDFTNLQMVLFDTEDLANIE